MKTTGVLIIGSGIGGIAAAIQLAQNPQRKIIVLNRSPDVHESNTFWAQGGIIRRGPGDSAGLLIQDILAAGAGASLPESARILAEEGPRLLDDVLIGQAGVQFDHESNGELSYGQEAAHSRRRIVHVGDGTGAAISRGLVALLKNYPNIEVLPNATAVDLITYPHHSRDPLDNYRPIRCHGAYVLTAPARPFIALWPPSLFLPRAAWDVYFGIQPILRVRAAMVLPWPRVPVRASSTPNIFNSTRLRWRLQERKAS